MTAVVNGYMTVDELKAVLRDSTPTWNDAYAIAINSASREIDQYCDDQFYTDPAGPTARVFKSTHRRHLRTPSIATAAGLMVEIDDDNDGTFETTLDPSEYQLAPTDRDPGWPYRWIELLGTRSFPGTGWGPYYGLGYGPGYGYGYGGPSWAMEPWRQGARARIRVTALWGWPQVPAQVRQACQMLAIDQFKSKDLTGAAAGTIGIATGPFSGQRDIVSRVGAMNPQAQALLAPLREMIVA